MYDLGIKAIFRLCQEQDALKWHQSKLGPQLFKGQELPVYQWVAEHVKNHHALPQPQTLTQKFGLSLEAPEPGTYYLELLENRFAYDQINTANIDSQTVLKNDKNAVGPALAVLEQAVQAIKQQQYRTKLVDAGQDAPHMLLQAYHMAEQKEAAAIFGWPYMDESTGGAMPGDVISVVGRPAAGKTFLQLRIAQKNWQAGKDGLFASMEIAPLPLVQRLAAMESHVPLGQLKVAGLASGPYEKFKAGLHGMKSNKAKLWIVDGNLAATPEDLYMLAAQLKVKYMVIDGGYLLRSKNPRLDRYTRVAENVEAMKHMTTSLGIPTFVSWQFSRQASQKKASKETTGLEDIAYSDAIGQISSIVLGMFQEEGVETMEKRLIRVLKGRSGEVGEFLIYWLFNTMNFDQVQDDKKELDYL